MARCIDAGAPGWAVESSLELSNALAQRGAPGDRDQAAALLARAVTDAEAIGKDVLAERARSPAAAI